MIRTYLLYLFTGLMTFWVVLFLFGISAGFSNYAPILALVGAVILFSVASPILVIKRKVGLILGLIGVLLLLPFDIGFTIGIFEEESLNWGTLLALIPIVLTLLTLIYSIKELRSTEKLKIGNRIIKVTMVALPLLLLLLYILFYGKYWSWQMFVV